MTPIELTQDHKDKLLEMAEKLFPEYPEVVFTENYHMDETGEIEFRDWEDKDSHNWTTTAPIYWFEFCMTKLLPEIKKLLPKETSSIRSIMHMYNFLWDVCNYDLTKTHPVDYLYKQFQKLD